MSKLAFETRDERARMLKLVDESPSDIEYGTAMAHAAAVNLGLVGDRYMLRRDCATIMLGEVRKYIKQKGLDLAVVENDVLMTAAFQRHYDYARMGPENAVELAVKEMDDSYEPKLIELEQPPGLAHVAVADEIIDKLSNADYWSANPREREDW